MAGFKHILLDPPHPTHKTWQEWGRALIRFLMLKLDQMDRENDLLIKDSGAPEGIVAAPVGTLYQRLDGATGTTLYVKETGGTGRTGWVAK